MEKSWNCVFEFLLGTLSSESNDLTSMDSRRVCESETASYFHREKSLSTVSCQLLI